MLMEHEDWMIRFIKEYQGRKLSILATGGGISLSGLARVPGASRVLHSFYCPYDTQESVEFINRHYPLARNKGKGFSDKAVSPESAEELFMALWTKNKMYGHLHIHNIAITAACTTTRYRRGDNQAYIAFKNEDTLDVEVWHVKVPKLSEEEHAKLLVDGKGGPSEGHKLYDRRVHEDYMIAASALLLACGFEPEILEEEKANGTLTRVHPQVTG